MRMAKNRERNGGELMRFLKMPDLLYSVHDLDDR